MSFFLFYNSVMKGYARLGFTANECYQAISSENVELKVTLTSTLTMKAETVSETLVLTQHRRG
jgi:hypothetical protein